MANANEIESSYVAVLSPAMTEITIPEGYELVSYTLRSKHDGHLQSYQPVDVQHFHTGPLLATPTETLNIGSSAQRSHQNVQGRLSSDSLTPTPSTISGPYPQQQLFNIPIRGGRERSTATDNAQTVSAHTQKRYNESGENGYTIACGVFSPERAPPVKKVNPKAGDFYCPRCGSNYTRAKTVKDHFPSCVLKYGNPDSLRYNSHESMPSKDAALHSSHRSYRASSSAGVDQADDMTAEDDQVIKNEYVSAADVPLDSIESHASGYQQHSTVRGRSVSFNPEQTPATPFWVQLSDPYYVPEPTPPYGYCMDETPAPVSRGSMTPILASRNSGSATPRPALQQSSSRTPTPALWSGSSVSPYRDPSEETGAFDDGDQMEE